MEDSTVWNVFVLMGAVAATTPDGTAARTTFKTDVVDEGDRPDVSSDGVLMGGVATTSLTRAAGEGDRPDVDSSLSMLGDGASACSLVDKPLASISPQGSSLLEHLASE